MGHRWLLAYAGGAWAKAWLASTVMTTSVTLAACLSMLTLPSNVSGLNILAPVAILLT